MKSATFATWMALMASLPAQLPFTYETTDVLSSAGDFGTADGIMDVVVVDRLTGNAIVGKQSAGGAMTFTAPEPCGITKVTGLAVDRFNGTGFGDVFAVTEPSSNRITQGYLEITGAPQFVFRHIYTANPSPRSIAPFNVNGDGLVDLMVVGQQSLTPAAHFYEMITNLSAGAVTLWQASYAPEVSRIYRFVQKTGTAPILAENFGTTFYVDALTATGFGPATRGLFDSPIDATSLMTYGNFDGSAYAQVILYKSGDVTVRATKVTEPTIGNFAWAPSTNLVFPKQIRQLFTIHIAGGGARLGVLFRDKTAAVYTFNGTTLTLRNTLAGAPFDWLNPLGNDVIVGKNLSGWRRFDTTSATANLLPTHTGAFAESATQARVSNVIFFSGEPFANATATPNEQSSIREWSTAVTGSGSSWTVSSANITPAGIGSTVASPYSSSAAATHGLPNQYRPNISTRSLEAGAGPLLLDVDIHPPGGVFRPAVPVQPVSITFTTTSFASLVKYRINNGAWLTYNFNSPPDISADSTVQAYATGGGRKSPIRSATYTFAAAPSLTIGASPDLDGDGLPDAWEKAFNLTSPSADADGDGIDNLGEYLLGTDPRDPTSAPPSSEFVLRSALTDVGGVRHLRLSWDNSLGSVTLQSSSSLLPDAWLPITSGISADGLERTYTVPTSSPAARFFRLRKP